MEIHKEKFPHDKSDRAYQKIIKKSVYIGSVQGWMGLSAAWSIKGVPAHGWGIELGYISNPNHFMNQR